MRKLILLLALIYPAVNAHAWHDEGHLYSALAAVRALPDDVPQFFRDGRKTVAHCSIDPDTWRHDNAPQIGNATSSDHYLDWEMVADLELPATRSDYVKLCLEHDIDPQNAGYLPYAIVEGEQRLALAFAEHRRWPDNPHIQIKCLVYAGILSHLTADLQMPLHTTIDFDGRTTRYDDGSFSRSPRTGIHARIDALPTKLPYAQLFTEPLLISPIEGDLMQAVLGAFAASHSLVDRCYELEADLPQTPDLNLTDPQVIAFTIERTRAAASFTAAIFLRAWTDSAAMTPADWLDRATLDEHLDETQVPPQ
ncbi:MAG: hypothetical protein IT445_03585 [Phycisphaeraceae bacterium]|nr:hypothetical protein [Phycisphaeraceae bacterium]